MARTISHSFAALTREILFLPFEHKIHIFSPPCNILCIYLPLILASLDNDRSTVETSCLTVVFYRYYTSDSLWKIWLVESIQSIHNSLWTWHDNCNIAFIMSSSTSAWLLSPVECSPQKQNGWTLHFCFWGWILWKMYNKTIIGFGFRMIFNN